MNELLYGTIALTSGVFLGTIFFGGLWWTVRKAMSSSQPALWFLGSLVLRTGIVLGGFYLVMQRGNWLEGLLCLLGFIAARLIVLRITRAYELRTESINAVIKGTIHEA